MQKLFFRFQIVGHVIIVALGLFGVATAYRALAGTGLNAWVAAQSVAHPAQAGLTLVASSIAIFIYSFPLARHGAAE